MFCEDSEKCNSCGDKDLCQMLENVAKANADYEPDVPTDDELMHGIVDYIIHILPFLNDKTAYELYNSLEPETILLVIAVSADMVLTLSDAWEQKCKEVKELKHQLEHQEASRRG